MGESIDCFPLEGKPLAKTTNSPDRAEEKMTVLDWIKLIFMNGPTYIIRAIMSRPSVVDARLASVRRIHFRTSVHRG